MTKRIELTQGYCALIDDDDYAELSKYKWTAWFDITGNGYAVRSVWKTRTTVYMHRQILGILDAGRRVRGDHINHNTLDNQRHNLRIVTHKQNLENRTGAQVNNLSTGVRGVSLVRSRGTYRAYVKHNGIMRNLGDFKTLAEADRAAVEGRAKYFTHHQEVVK